MTLDRDHWIRRNDTSWSPRRVIVVDAEGDTAKGPDSELDTFRLAVATFTVRAGDRRRSETTEDHLAHTPAELWSWVSSRCHSGRQTMLVAHGLHYDYTVTAAHTELELLGWSRVDWSTRMGARWVRWRRGRSTLLMVDLFNYLPTNLAAIGKMIGVPKLGLPKATARPRTWERYCRRDVEIARVALLHLLDWWDSSDLGRWTLTSAGLAFNAFRHRFMEGRSIRAHDTPPVRALEREALFGGRREIHRKGRLPDGVWVDLDYVTHYAMTAGLEAVPVRLQQRWEGFEPWFWRNPSPTVGAIARVEVEVASPVVPYRHPRLGVIYPVGRFVTTLCSPELRLVERHGRILRWIEGASYSLSPVFEQWSDWLLPRVVGPDRERDELVRILLKDWTRSLIGKFGQRAPAPRPSSGPAVELEPIEITVTPGAGKGDLPWSDRPPEDPLRGADAYNAVPAITAWVHSAARVQLWEGMSAAGRDEIAYCDTDGFLVRAHEGNLERLAAIAPSIDATARTPAAAIPEPKGYRTPASHAQRRSASRPTVPEIPWPEERPGELAVKGRFGEVVIHRAQDYELDGREVIKGLPREREELGPRTYRATYWPGIPWQLAHGKPGTYLRPLLTVHLGDHYDRGWVLSDGRVVPLETRWGKRGLRILAWDRTSYARAGLELMDPAQGPRIAARARSPGP